MARTEGKPVFWLKPDLAVRRGQIFPLLMDAKYKRLASDVSGVDVGQGDFYQMFAYAHRYDCPRVLMIYPQTADIAKRPLLRLRLGKLEREVSDRRDR